MDIRDFDAKIKEKLEKGGKIQSVPQWENIAGRINTKNSKKAFLPWIWTAAAALIAFAIWNFGIKNKISNTDNLINNPSMVLNQENLKEKESFSKEMLEQEKTKIQDSKENKIIEPQINQQRNKNHIVQHNIKNKHDFHSDLHYSNDENSNNNHKYAHQTPFKDETWDAKELLDNKGTKTEQAISKNLAQNDDYNPYYSESMQNQYFKENNRLPNFSLGVNAGIQYGNQQAGYALALNARQNISDKLYIEGSVGMVFSDNSNQVVGLPTSVSHVPTSAIPIKNAIKRSAFNHIYNVNTFYLEFSPSIGYRLTDVLSISTGPDIQHLMNYKQNENQFNFYAFQTDGTIGLIPNTDWGIKTQTELDLSKNLKAGLSYRQGLNNINNTSSMKKVNRNYIQLQFKYAFGLKKE